MHQKILDLQAKAAKAAPEVQAKLKEQADALQKKWEASEKKLAELQKASGKAWEEFIAFAINSFQLEVLKSP